VAEADDDCRPPWWASHRVRTKTNRVFAANALRFNVRAFSPDGDCATGRIGAGFRTAEKKQCSKSVSVDFAPAARELTWSNWIIFVSAKAVSEGHHG
jgi:hypothetical protein